MYYAPSALAHPARRLRPPVSAALAPFRRRLKATRPSHLPPRGPPCLRRPTPAHRNHVRTVRLTRGENALFRAKAHAAGLTVSELIRRLVLGKKVPVRRGRFDEDALYQLSRIGNNLNQIARALNTARKRGVQPVGLERLAEVLEELHVLLDQLTE